MSDMSGKVALVTGASRGIGAAIAARFAAGGAAVAVTARTADEGDNVFAGSVATTVSSIADAGGTAIAVIGDLAVQADRARIVAETVERLGPVDVLVNNAAVTYFQAVEGFDERRYELMFEVQVRAPFELAQHVLEGMRSRHAGWILNISSGAAIHPKGPPFRTLPGGTVYGMCKAALERFTTGLAAEVYGDGIAVNALSPSGLVLTPGVLHHRLDQFTPADRVEPAEYIAEAAWALCTGDPASLTGRVTYAKPLLTELGIALEATP
jgi:NAD(P)-dependent dehydrogenase (short-subunit alcohol dehydrogenase family)